MKQNMRTFFITLICGLALYSSAAFIAGTWQNANETVIAEVTGLELLELNLKRNMNYNTISSPFSAGEELTTSKTLTILPMARQVKNSKSL